MVCLSSATGKPAWTVRASVCPLRSLPPSGWVWVTATTLRRLGCTTHGSHHPSTDQHPPSGKGGVSYHSGTATMWGLQTPSCWNTEDPLTQLGPHHPTLSGKSHWGGGAVPLCGHGGSLMPPLTVNLPALQAWVTQPGNG